MVRFYNVLIKFEFHQINYNVDRESNIPFCLNRMKHNEFMSQTNYIIYRPSLHNVLRF